ncbi:DUF3365 domain-containing protein [Algoriphagus lutimaris]|uniref:Tll0287-like domain-containing protein n=1 Tax=Algoriphagus lutimaris TaxID=613197 RepID=UPI00196B44F6|nr:DUF3365 domain-containing protein [Algoriphagus lutimaris]MBN3520882.1 DUF3365 domain-containing protein [Algoriphagus lutimaris]
MNNTYLTLGLFLFLISCGPRERVSKEVFDEVNKTMEVKRLSDAEILQEAMIWGDSLTSEAQKNLISSLQKAIEEGGFEHAIAFCKENASTITASKVPTEEIQLKRVAFKNRNPQNVPDSDEALILDAYSYNAENGIENKPNIQKVENGEVFLYTKAIMFPGGVCSNCHGDPNTEISSEVLKSIKELYPADQATGFQQGDLRGMWSLKIPKKEVVKRL